MAPKPPRELPDWAYKLSVVGWIAIAVAYAFFGRSIGLRALGAGLVAGAGLQQWMGTTIRYVFEDNERSAHLQGWKLTTFNIVLGLIGAAMAATGKSPWSILFGV